MKPSDIIRDPERKTSNRFGLKGMLMADMLSKQLHGVRSRSG